MIKQAIEVLTEHILLIMAVIFGGIALIFRTPIEQQYVFNYFGIPSPQTSFDMPSIFTWFFFLLFFIAVIDSVFINQKAYHSDFCWAGGLDYNSSCIGANLKTVGEWCWIRTEGIKSFPIEGNHVVANLASHTHRIGNHVVMEGHVIPHTPLTHIPAEIKLDVRQRRMGLFGASECSIGYLSHKELSLNKQFKTDDYKDLIDTVEQGKTFDTAAFIDSIRDKNRDLNMIIEFNNGEHDSLTQYLENMVQVGRAVTRFRDDSPVDKLFRKG